MVVVARLDTHTHAETHKFHFFLLSQSQSFAALQSGTQTQDALDAQS